MKKYLLCGLAVLGSAAAHAQLTPTGGPDAFGYTWQTSAVPGGPTYQWVDIRTRGTQVMGLDDDNLAPTPLVLPFDFPFYLRSFDRVRIASNGYLALTYPGGPAPASLAQPFPAIPTAGDQPRAFLAGFLADLIFSNTGANAANPAQCYYMMNADSLVVSYLNVPFWERAAAGQPTYRGANTFQIILSRLDSSITYQYQAMDQTLPTPMPPNSGPTRVGIEDLTGTIGLEAGEDQIPDNGSAVKFYRPRATTLQFIDLASNGFNNPDGSGFFTLLGQPLPVRASFSNSGNRDATAFTVTSRITNRPGFPVAPLDNQTTMVAGLRAQRDTLITFPVAYTPGTAAPSAGTGAFKVVNTVQLTGDQFTPNNTRQSMFVVVDTANVAEVVLSYDDESPNNLVGLGGAGVYFQPPFYPAHLRASEAFVGNPMMTPIAVGGMKMKVYADNGPNGTPGTLLYSDSLAEADITIGAPNLVTLRTPVTITSGGFYISWVADSATAQYVLAHAPTGGQAILSAHRSYEVANGTFAPYRNSDDNIAITATIAARLLLGVSEDRSGQLALAPAFPNPAADRTTLGFTLRRAAPTTLTVRDLLGRPVRTVALGSLPAGDHRYELSTAALAPGVYTYSLSAGSIQLTRKLLVQR